MWHYAAKKFNDENEEWWGVVEVYPELSKIPELNMNEGVAHTGEVHISADSPKDLAKWLRIAAADIEKYGDVDEG